MSTFVYVGGGSMLINCQAILKEISHFVLAQVVDLFALLLYSSKIRSGAKKCQNWDENLI